MRVHPVRQWQMANRLSTIALAHRKFSVEEHSRRTARYASGTVSTLTYSKKFVPAYSTTMTTSTRLATFAAALSLGFGATLNAQTLATFGSAELAGFGEGSALIGTSMSTGKQGWGPMATIVGQTYRYISDPLTNSHAQAYAISPSVGLQYSMPTGAVSAGVGYTFVSTEFNGIVSGAEVGGRSGTFVTGQANYWGDGENSAQLIGSYGFKSEYYWSRVRAAHRLSPSANPVYLGGEFVLQGAPNGYLLPSGLRSGDNIMRYEVGPTIEYRVTPEFRLGASGGFRGGNSGAISSGYARIEFLLLTKLGM